jgi:hypothetical protein
MCPVRNGTYVSGRSHPKKLRSHSVLAAAVGFGPQSANGTKHVQKRQNAPFRGQKSRTKSRTLEQAMHASFEPWVWRFASSLRRWLGVRRSESEAGYRPELNSRRPAGLGLEQYECLAYVSEFRSRDNAERELPRPAPTATKNSWSPKIRCLGKFLIGKKVCAGSGRRVRVSTKVNCPALHLSPVPPREPFACRVAPRSG